jgi:hypothetical protein
VWKAFQALRASGDPNDVKRVVHLERYFSRFCENGPESMAPEQFKREGAFKAGHAKVAVWEFKAWQFRIYGATLTVTGRVCFVGVKYDPSKKRNKADAVLLKSAAEAIASLDEYK